MGRFIFCGIWEKTRTWQAIYLRTSVTLWLDPKFALDVSGQFPNGFTLFGIFIGNFDTKLFLTAHKNFYNVHGTA